MSRTPAGSYGLGAGLAVLARGGPDLPSVALPELSELANRVGMTAFVVVADGGDAVTNVVASAAVVFAGKADEPALADQVMAAAREIAAELP